MELSQIYGYPNAIRPPFGVMIGDSLASSTYWHGFALNEWANDWVKLHSGGEGNFVMTNMEDSGTATALMRLSQTGKVDFQRLLVLRTANNFSTPPIGKDVAWSLNANAGEWTPLEATYSLGKVIADELAGNWDRYADPNPALRSACPSEQSPPPHDDPHPSCRVSRCRHTHRAGDHRCPLALRTARAHSRCPRAVDLWWPDRLQYACRHLRPPSNLQTQYYDAQGGILAPGLVDPHIRIGSMMACAYAEAALLNGTTTIFCDSHEIGNVSSVDGIEWMLEDARRAPLNIFLTVPSTVPATSATFETAGGDLTPEKIAALFDKWPEAVALGEKWTSLQVCTSDERSHAIIAESLKRGKPVCGHIYGREFVSAYAAAGVTDTREAIDKEIAEDLLEAGLWIFLRGGRRPHRGTACRKSHQTGHRKRSCRQACLRVHRRADADDLFLFGMDWVVRQAVKSGLKPNWHGVQARCGARATRWT